MFVPKQGRTFRGIIQDFLASFGYLNKVLIPAYSTPEGKKAYEDGLKCVQEHFPQYVREIKGTAEGARVPFLHVSFLRKHLLDQRLLIKSDDCSVVNRLNVLNHVPFPGK